MENCLESKEVERSELEKSCGGVQSVLKQVQEEKSQLLASLTDVRKERNDARDEVKNLNEMITSLQDRLLSSCNKCSVLEQWLDEINANKNTSEQVWKSRMEATDVEKQQLYMRIMELETDVSITLMNW